MNTFTVKYDNGFMHKVDNEGRYLITNPKGGHCKAKNLPEIVLYMSKMLELMPSKEIKLDFMGNDMPAMEYYSLCAIIHNHNNTLMKKL